jgi:oligopeptidase A
MTNPLLDLQGLPPFDRIRADHVTPAVDSLLAQAEAALEKAVSPELPADYDALSAVLDVATERLSRAWGAVRHLNAVLDTPALRAAYTENLPRITEFHTRLGADERLFAKYKAILATPASQSMSAGSAQGAGEHGARFRALRRRAAGRGAKAALRADPGVASRTRPAILRARARRHRQPCAVRRRSRSRRRARRRAAGQSARAAAQAEGREGCKLTLHFPSYLPVMQYAATARCARSCTRAYVTRASEFGPSERDNGPLMRELLALRQEEAQLLGKTSYAEVSLVPKMAQSPQQVIDFLRDLARRARPGAERDLAELRAFARDELGLPDLQAWDMPFASERLKEKRYAFSDQEVKPYFTEPSACSTACSASSRPCSKCASARRGAGVAPERALLPHRAPFGRRCRAGAAGRPVLPRPLRPRGQAPRRLDGRHARAAGRAPTAACRRRWRTWCATLRHRWTAARAAHARRRETLFHEFGHGLHHMLTQVDDLGVSGISGVEWDAVELPSQFMENFCWEWEVLQRLTAHVDSGEPLPRALFDRMLAAKNFHSGCRCCARSSSRCSTCGCTPNPATSRACDALADEVRAEVALVPRRPSTAF